MVVCMCSRVCVCVSVCCCFVRLVYLLRVFIFFFWLWMWFLLLLVETTSISNIKIYTQKKLCTHFGFSRVMQFGVERHIPSTDGILYIGEVEYTEIRRKVAVFFFVFSLSKGTIACLNKPTDKSTENYFSPFRNILSVFCLFVFFFSFFLVFFFLALSRLISFNNLLPEIMNLDNSTFEPFNEIIYDK